MQVTSLWECAAQQLESAAAGAASAGRNTHLPVLACCALRLGTCLLSQHAGQHADQASQLLGTLLGSTTLQADPQVRPQLLPCACWTSTRHSLGWLLQVQTAALELACVAAGALSAPAMLFHQALQVRCCAGGRGPAAAPCRSRQRACRAATGQGAMLPWRRCCSACGRVRTRTWPGLCRRPCSQVQHPRRQPVPAAGLACSHCALRSRGLTSRSVPASAAPAHGQAGGGPLRRRSRGFGRRGAAAAGPLMCSGRPGARRCGCAGSDQASADAMWALLSGQLGPADDEPMGQLSDPGPLAGAATAAAAAAAEGEAGELLQVGGLVPPATSCSSGRQPLTLPARRLCAGCRRCCGDSGTAPPWQSRASPARRRRLRACRPRRRGCSRLQAAVSGSSRRADNKTRHDKTITSVQPAWLISCSLPASAFSQFATDQASDQVEHAAAFADPVKKCTALRLLCCPCCPSLPEPRARGMVSPLPAMAVPNSGSDQVEEGEITGDAPEPSQVPGVSGRAPAQEHQAVWL